MTVTLADLNPTNDELERLLAALTDATGNAHPDALTASFDTLGLDAWDRVSLAVAAENRFAVTLDKQIAGEHTAADLLAALRAAPKWGALPHA